MILFIDEIVMRSEGNQAGVELDRGTEWVMAEEWDIRSFQDRIKQAWKVFSGRAYAHRFMRTKEDVQEARNRGYVFGPTRR